MTSEALLLIVSFSTVLQFCAFFISIYALRFVDFRAAWAVVGLVTFLMAVHRSTTLADVWMEPEAYPTSVTAELIALSISLLVVVGLSIGLSLVRNLSHRLELSEQNQKALQESELKFKALTEGSDAGFVVLDADGNVLECNETYIKLTGRKVPEEIIGHNLAEWVVNERNEGEVYVSDELAKIREEQRETSNQRAQQYEGAILVHPDGKRIPIVVLSSAVETPSGLQILALVRDISEREEARKKLEASEKRANLLLDCSPISTAIFSSEGHLLRTNKAHDDLWGVPFGELLVEPDSDLEERLNILKDPQSLAILGKDRLEAVFAGERLEIGPLTYRASEFNPAMGRDNFVMVLFFPLLNDSGGVEQVVQMHVDLTERIIIEQKLREREALYRAVIDATNDGFAVLLPDETVVDANDEYVRIVGHKDLSEIKGRISRQWVSEDMGLEELGRLLKEGGKRHGVRIDYKHEDGSIVPAEVSGAVVETDSGPQVVVLARDISERLQVEEKLRQAQKMDAIGKLTGGVAHDFNNLLAVVFGNAELALGNETAEREVGTYLNAILVAAERGADLTHRLLAFSRQTPLAPKVINIDDALDNAHALLQRLIGEDIDLVLIKAKDTPSCEVDPSELESVIVNLANNAREAMPKGGKLIIETDHRICDQDSPMVSAGELAAGEYVVVSISDSGVGIEPDILDKVTEPFFTTKNIAEGAGLGLSMAYGFAKQSNGHLTIYSEPGEGTTIKLYLPAHLENAQELATDIISQVPHGDEKILLVEDDPALNALACHMLEVLEYRVETAGDARTAIELFHRHGDFDMLVTDIMLPGGLNGQELAEQLLSVNPQLKVMFMSGYTENTVLHHGRLDEGVVLLQKPFRILDLGLTVRQVLDA